MWQQANSRFGLASPREQRNGAEEMSGHSDCDNGSRHGFEGLSKQSSSSVRRFETAESISEQARILPSSLAEHDLIREITSGVLEGMTRNAFWDRHTELLETINRVQSATLDNTAVMQQIAQLGLRERHSELVEAITNITVEPTDLGPILTALEDPALHRRHSEVLEAIETTRLSLPEMAAMQTVVREVQSDLQNVLAEMRRDLTIGFQELRQDLASVRREVSEGRKESRADSDVTIAELRALPQVLGDMTQILRKLDRQTDHSEVLGDMTQILRKLDRQTDNTEVLQAVRGINVEPDARRMADAVHERLRSSGALQVDNADVLQALRRLEPDHDTIANVVLDKLGNVRLNVNHDEVLHHVRRIPDHDSLLRSVEEQHQRMHEAICGIRVPEHDSLVEAVHLRMRDHIFQVDYDAIAAVVCDRLQRQKLNVDDSKMLESVQESRLAVQEVLERRLCSLDHAPILEALRRIHIPDHETIASALHDRIRVHTFNVDNSDILRAIRNIDVDLTPVHDAIGRIKVDHAPVLDAIKRIGVHDHQSIANAVHEKIRKHVFSVDQGEVLRAISKINTEPDLTPLRNAITAAEVDLSPVLDAISSINLHVDHTPVVEAIKRISMPDVHTLATIINDKLRKSVLTMDQSEAIDEIRRLRVEPDLTPMMNAINAVVGDVASLTEAVGRIHRAIDYGPLLEAVKRINIPDAHSLAGAVAEHVRRTVSSRDNDLFHELRQIKVDPDLGPLVQAINSAEVDLSPVLEAINSLSSVMLSVKEQFQSFHGNGEHRIVETVVPQIIETVVPQVVETMATVPQVVERVEAVVPVERTMSRGASLVVGPPPMVSAPPITAARSSSPLQRVITPRIHHRQLSSMVHRPGEARSVELGAPRPVELYQMPVGTMPVGYVTPPPPGTVPATSRASMSAEVVSKYTGSVSADVMSPILSPTPSMTSIPMAPGTAVLSGMEQTFQESMEVTSPGERRLTASLSRPVVDRMVSSGMDNLRARAQPGSSVKAVNLGGSATTPPTPGMRMANNLPDARGDQPTSLSFGHTI